MNTHRAIVETSVPPTLDLIAAGDLNFCVRSLDGWLAKHPLNAWQKGLVVAVAVTVSPLDGAEVPDDRLVVQP